MKRKLFDIGDNNIPNIDKKFPQKDIAIIGVSCHFGSAQNLDEYWDILSKGKDCIRNLPISRQTHLASFIDIKKALQMGYEYDECGFMDEIDKFDYDFFSISPLEASVIDPNQRIFLETAYAAIDDAGYGGKKIYGSKTGVFLGHSDDFGENYKDIIDSEDTLITSISMVGNIKSIIASRISYLLNLKGPSMLVNTACSSSLVALHLACQSLRNVESELALVGSSKIRLIPIRKVGSKGVGLRAGDNRTKAFDDRSDGIGAGEGVGALLLKPLEKAVKDRDHIYAVIKGSAVNQDGNSIGITAPNSIAQEEVIIKAWQDANIFPETISYIEAHGTGTKLGDPIEINGIERAFSRYTRKKQFCAIGSVKTNIGHLDNAAGLAGLIKVILALKHKQIPATLHFNCPNKNINFTTSPVYINDRLTHWDASELPRRAGISAFGLSGTNCHVVLEEAPEMLPESEIKGNTEYHIFTLSAKHKEALNKSLDEYVKFFESDKDINIGDLCYTCNTGREHFRYRVAIVVKDINELKEKISLLRPNNFIVDITHKGINYGEYKLVSADKANKESGEITYKDKENINNHAKEVIEKYRNKCSTEELLIEELWKAYVSGADIDWDEFYRGSSYNKISLPTYAFVKRPCWIQKQYVKQNVYNLADDNEIRDIPRDILIGKCQVESIDRIIYSNQLSADKHWILNEHKVNGYFVIPGTTYLEMVRKVISLHYVNKVINLKDVVFISPFALLEGESKEIQTIIKLEGQENEFSIVSKSNTEDRWIKHVEGKFDFIYEEIVPKNDILEIKEKCRGGKFTKFPYLNGKEIDTGERWNNLINVEIGEYEYLGYLELPNKYVDDLEHYSLHPALMDRAVNLALRTIGDGLYLPWVYKNITIYGNMPRSFYSYVRRNKLESEEIASFDVTLIDEAGNIFVQINDYLIKKVTQIDNFDKQLQGYINTIYQLSWVEKEATLNTTLSQVGCCLVFEGKSSIARNTIDLLEKSFSEVVRVTIGNEFKKINDRQYTISYNESDYALLIDDIKNKNITKIIHLSTITELSDHESLNDLNNSLELGVYSVFYIVKTLINKGVRNKIEIILITDYACEVTKDEIAIRPENAAFLSYSKVINDEYPNLKCKGIDIDMHTPAEKILSEICLEADTLRVAYRHGRRYIEELESTNINGIEPIEFKIRGQGVYIIAGGLGSLGLEMGKYLASKGKANIALIGRTKLPHRDEWNTIMTNDKDKKLITIISTIKDIEEQGSEVSCHSVDISDYAELKAVVEELKKEYGSINGIINAAGIAGESLIALKSKQNFENVIRPKILGSFMLHKIVEDDELDFFITFSSINSMLGGAGQSDYTAANAYMDAFAIYRNKKNKCALSINWPAWKEIGMAVKYGKNNDGVFKAITTRQALSLFDDIINRKINGVVVFGELNYNSDKLLNNNSLPFMLSENIMRNTVKRSDARQQNSTQTTQIAVKLKGRHKNEEYTKAELIIGQIWGLMLSINTINIYDNFFELGGNSLVAIKFEMEMENNNIKIQYSDIYNYPTIKELASYIMQKQLETNSADKDDNDSSKLNTINLEGQDTIISQELSARIDEIDRNNGVFLDKRVKVGNKTIIGNISPFNDFIYKGCFYSALFPIIGYYNQSIDHILANDIISYQYDADNKMLDILYKSEKDVESLLKDMALELNKKIYSGDVIKDIINSLLNNRPIIVTIDCFYESIRQDTYLKTHWPHSLLIYGFDNDSQIFNIFEQKHRESLVYESCTISYEDIEKAYNGFISNFKHLDIVNATFNQLTYIPGMYMPTIFEVHKIQNENCVLRVEDSIKSYINRVFNEYELILNNLEYINEFSSIFCKIVKDEESIKEKAKKLMGVLNSIISGRQVEKYKVEKLLGAVPGLISNLDEVIDRWNYIRSRLFRYLYSSIYKREDFDEISKIFDQVYLGEKEYYQKLYEYISK